MRHPYAANHHHFSLRGIAAMLVAAMLAAVALVAAPGPASGAESAGVTLSVSYGDQTYDGTAVVSPGTSYTARLQYSVPALTPGGTATVQVPAGVTVPEGALTVPAGNTIVESLTLDDEGNVLVSFKDPLDSSVDQGVLAFDFQFDEPEQGTGYRDVSWTVGGEGPTTTRVIVRDPGDELRPNLTDSERKDAQGSDLSSAVSRDAQGTVSVDPAVTDIAIPYVVRIESAQARTGVTITDTIADELAHDAGSIVATLVTWDEDGFNRTSTPFSLPAPTVAAQTLTVSGIDLPANSILEIAYDAHVRPEAVSGIEARLQERADDVDPVAGGDYSVAFVNEAQIDGSQGSASVSMGGRVSAEPAPNIGAAFSKQSSLSGQTPIMLDEDGELAAPVDVAYTFEVDLTQFAEFTSTRHALDRNVVITDVLPDQIEWDDEPFVTATGIELSPASIECLATTDFADDECVGMYTLLSDGSTLLVNVGSDVSGEYAIQARATITSVSGLPAVQRPAWLPQVETLYTATNDAYFQYREGHATGSQDGRHSAVDDDLAVPRGPGAVVDDPSQFDKASGGDVVVRPGAVAWVPYTFTLAAGAVEDFRLSRIIDSVDTSVFDVSDLGAIAATIEGTYGYQQSLSGADFDLAWTDGELVLTASDAFGQDLPEWFDTGGALTDRLQFTIELPTHPIVGKQTLEVDNSARVEGDDEEAYVWYSEASSSTTSFGDELEVRKTLYGADGEWTRTLRVGLDDDGQILSDEFVYRVELIPHGNYSDVQIIPLADTLPEQTSFLGFVADENVATGEVSSTDTYDMGGNVRATWHPDEGTIRIEQRDGTVLPAGARAVLNFKVQLNEYTEDVGVTNAIGGASATIVPSDGYPLSIAKVDSVRPELLITDRDARFTITAPDGSIVTEAAYVVDGQLVVAGADGGDRAIVVPAGPNEAVPAGDYTIMETVAPAGYALTTTSVIATISETGATSSAVLPNEPLPLFAIGDLVWIDADSDGIQDADEEPLADVVVELIDPATGDVRAQTTTDEQGRYLFDLLAAGDYQVRFTLTPAQAEVFTFTQALVGDDGSVQSDADRATGLSPLIVLGDDNQNLVADVEYAPREVRALNGVDPTWDAGVVLRPATVEVGDLVWIDEDRDGRQSAGEPGIAGVVLVVEGPDGHPVEDVDGRLVGPQTTDEDGRYLFTDLPVLEDGQSYTVRIDREASTDALRSLRPTVEGQGERSGDSSTWSASSQGLIEGGQQDLTLDFGFVREDSSQGQDGVDGDGEGDTPGTPTDDGVLSSTGANVLGATFMALLLMCVGAAFVLVRRAVRGGSVARM